MIRIATKPLMGSSCSVAFFEVICSYSTIDTPTRSRTKPNHCTTFNRRFNRSREKIAVVNNFN